jgi:hypothetical protein
MHIKIKLIKQKIVKTVKVFLFISNAFWAQEPIFRTFISS